MIKVLLRAPLLTNSGYGVHSRQVFAWLNGREDIDLTVECVKWGNTSWLLNSESEGGLIGKIMECSKPLNPEGYDVSFQVILPDEWDTKLAKKNIGITALVETDRCPQKWVSACNKMDHVVLPSTFTKNVLQKSGLVTTKLSVIPEWFNHDILNKSKMSKTQVDERYDVIKKDFNILLVGALTSLAPEQDRKNIDTTIKWLCEEFANDDVGLVLKTTMGKSTESEKDLCRKYLKESLKRHKKGSFPSVYMIHGNMEKHEIAGLYDHRKIKMLVSATRGEGYGLPLIESAAAGIPVVSTNWSGHLEFLKEGYFGAVDYKLVDIPETKIDNRIFLKGFKWAEPDEHSFKSEVRKVYEHYSEAKEKAKILKKEINFNFNKDAIKKQYDKLLTEVLEK